MLTTARGCDDAKTVAWNAGTRGAPCPPAAMSRLRKSATTSMPVRFGQPRRSVQLERVAGVRPVPDGLSVRANRRDLRCSDARIGEHSSDRVGVDLRERYGGHPRALDLVRSGTRQFEQFVAQIRRKRPVRMRQRSWRVHRKVGEDRVDTIQAGAGHQSDEKLGKCGVVEACGHAAVSA